MYRAIQRVLVTVLLLFGGLLLCACAAEMVHHWLYPPMDGKKARALYGCKGVSQAIDNYINSPLNRQQEAPNALSDLHQPPFGGPSLLRNGVEDLRDPWGKPYEMERHQREDGNKYFLIKTTAPDGTLISNYGVGPTAIPKFQAK